MRGLSVPMQFPRHRIFDLRLKRLPDIWRVRRLQSPELGDGDKHQM